MSACALGYGRGVVRRLPFLAALACGVLALTPGVAHSARATIPLHACDAGKPVLCGTVEVPLDYSGKTPGTLKLAVEELPAKGAAKGTFFMIAGGPGQGSIEAYGLKVQGDFFQAAFPGYNLVTFDDRGTGISNPLSCPALEKRIATAGIKETATLAGICGRQLGANRLFYGTRDHADDVESVRQALGLGKIGVYGVSYGTKESEAYVMAYPQSVERVLLDSVVVPEGPDLFALDTLKALPGALGRLCGKGACDGLTKNLGHDVAVLANRLEKKPVFFANVPDPTKTQQRGKPAPEIRVVIDGYRFMNLVVDADLLPTVAVELPTAVHSALKGWYGPLKRLYGLDTGASAFGDIDVGLFITTTCVDGNFMWSPTSPISTHQSLYDQAVAQLEPGATGEFGKWAAEFGTAATCTEWPSPSGGQPLKSNPLPDVPVLVLSGDRDTRTPTAGAIEVASRFKHAYLTVVPGVGHSVLGADLSGCAQSSVIGWLQGRTPPTTCPPSPPLLPVMGPFYKSLNAAPVVGKIGGKIGHTLGAVVSTLDDAADTYLFEQLGISSTAQPGLVARQGLEGGLLTSFGSVGAFSRKFTMQGYSDIPGVELNGTLSIFPGGLPLQFEGKITVTGDKAANGTLTLHASSITGKLGGRRVAGTTGHKGFFGPGVTAFARHLAG
jgi:pimeloyl-ACP methyl ester carboxylesterase